MPHEHEHHRHIIDPDYMANDHRDQRPVFSTIGKGPKGNSITVTDVESLPGLFKFKIHSDDGITPDIESANLSAGVITITQEANPVAGVNGIMRVTITREGEAPRTTEVSIPAGDWGSRAFTTDVTKAYDPEEAYTFSFVDIGYDSTKKFPPLPRVNDFLFFSCIKDTKNTLAIANIEKVNADNIIVAGRFYQEFGIAKEVTSDEEYIHTEDAIEAYYLEATQRVKDAVAAAETAVQGVTGLSAHNYVGVDNTDAKHPIVTELPALQTAIEAVNVATLTEANAYTDTEIANALTATQVWLPAIDDLPIPPAPDDKQTYLIRVRSEEAVYQCVAGQSDWVLYEDHADYVTEDEMTEAFDDHFATPDPTVVYGYRDGAWTEVVVNETWHTIQHIDDEYDGQITNLQLSYIHPAIPMVEVGKYVQDTDGSRGLVQAIYNDTVTVAYNVDEHWVMSVTGTNVDNTDPANPVVNIPDASQISTILNTFTVNVEDAIQDIDDLAKDAQPKEAGKGLSTNDYTTAEKTKLAGIEAGAEVNVTYDFEDTDEGWKVTDSDGGEFEHTDKSSVYILEGDEDEYEALSEEVKDDPNMIFFQHPAPEVPAGMYLIKYTDETETLVSVSEGTTTLTINNNNNIKELRFGALPNIINLQCRFNYNMTKLDLSGVSNLQTIHCYSGSLTKLDLSVVPNLLQLMCYDNYLSELDVTNNTALTNLQCGRNQLSELDVTNNTALQNLHCSTNQLSELDVTNNTALTNLQCAQNQLSELDVTNNVLLGQLSCENNQLSELDITNNVLLQRVYCSSNMLEALSIEGLSNLYYLRCDNNSIVSLLGNLNNIMTLHCQNNLLSNLTVGTSSGLSELLCYGNPTLNIITLKAFTGFANIMQDTTNLPGGQIYLPISDMSKSGYTAFSTRVGAAGYTIFLT